MLHKDNNSNNKTRCKKWLIKKSMTMRKKKSTKANQKRKSQMKILMRNQIIMSNLLPKYSETCLFSSHAILQSSYTDRPAFACFNVKKNALYVMSLGLSIVSTTLPYCDNIALI